MITKMGRLTGTEAEKGTERSTRDEYDRNTLCFIKIYVLSCVCAPGKCGACRAAEALDSLELELEGLKSPDVGADSQTGPLEEQKGTLATEPSPQAQNILYTYTKRINVVYN